MYFALYFDIETIINPVILGYTQFTLCLLIFFTHLCILFIQFLLIYYV